MQRFIMLLPMLLIGCVSAGKYDDLKKLYDHAQKESSDRGMQIGTLEHSLADERAKSQSWQDEATREQRLLAVLEQQHADVTAEMSRLQAEHARLQGDFSALVKDRSQLKQSTEQLQQALAQLSARKLEAERRVAEFKTLLARFKNLIDAGTLTVAMVDGRMVLQLPSDVLFDSGQAKLSKLGKEAVQQVAHVLSDIRQRRFQIEGHTDNVPIHNSQYQSNWELASARAMGVVREMTGAGMDSTLVSAASYGEFHPAATNDTDPGRASNRRIEIVLVPDLSMLPGFEELTAAVERS
jgi:chemotaxis protein MotB